MDIVERLRAGIKMDDGNPEIGRPPTMLIDNKCAEAADEIERLRAALNECADIALGSELSPYYANRVKELRTNEQQANSTEKT